MPQLSHQQIDIYTHTAQLKRQGCVRVSVCASARKVVGLLQTRAYNEGLPWPECRQQSSVNWDLFCLPPRDNNVSVLSLSVFSLSNSFPFIRSLTALSLFHPAFRRCTSSAGWPSATSTPCPVWQSRSGWLWCLEHQRRTSSVVTSWGSSPCWWSRPPRTSWVSTRNNTCLHSHPV